MHIHVCPLSSLSDSIKSTSANWLISLSGPGKGIANPGMANENFLSLEFNDISEPQSGLVSPNADHIRKIIDFSESWQGDGTLVIQCWMGISRSTATALIVALALNPAFSPQEMTTLLRKNSSSATPNPLMIKLADDILALDGRLVEAVQQIGRGSEASQGYPFDIVLPTELLL